MCAMVVLYNKVIWLEYQAEYKGELFQFWVLTEIVDEGLDISKICIFVQFLYIAVMNYQVTKESIISWESSLFWSVI